MKDSEKDKMIQEVLKKFCEKEDINIKANIYLSDNLTTPVTIGILHKKIILPNEKWSEENLRDVFCHEIIHIKAMDNLIKMLLLLAVIINFYNPLVYYLMYRWNLMAEIYCDEKVIADKSNQEIKNYANLIIDFAEEKDNFNLPVLGLSMDKRQMKERIMNMKKTQKKNGMLSKVLGAVVIAATLFASSLTAFAYEERDIEYFNEEYDGGEIEIWLTDDTNCNISLQQDTKLMEYEKYINCDYSVVCVDESGNIYYQTEKETRALCNHTYEDVTYIKHTKKSDGNCAADYYSAKRCSKCGDIILGSYIKTVTYAKCPH